MNRTPSPAPGPGVWPGIIGRDHHIWPGPGPGMGINPPPAPGIPVVSWFFFGFFRFFCCFMFVFLLTIFRRSNNVKRFKKYPDTFGLLHDQGETSNQHLIIAKEYNIYVRRVS